MFERVLIPLDLSGRGRLAIDALPALGKPGLHWVKLLHVIEAIDDGSTDEFADFYASLRSKAEKHLDELARELADRGFEVEVEITVGKRSREILRQAESDGCDTIILPSRMPEATGRGFGTVSQQVALLARCSVFLVR